MKLTSFFAYVRTSPDQRPHIECLTQIKMLCHQGHVLNGVFFHDTAVLAATNASEMSQQWLHLAKQANCPLTLCINSTKKLKLEKNIIEGFTIGSLGDLIELEEQSDNYISDVLANDASLITTHMKHTATKTNNANAKNCLFIFEHSPYQNAFTQAGLDSLFAHASLGRQCTVLLINKGINLLTATYNNNYKNTSKQLAALPLYDIETLYICAGENNETNLQTSTALNIKQVNIKSVQDMIQNSGFVYYY